MIDIEQLSYRYAGADSAALNGVTMHIQAGDLFGLLGPNGAGKTTLLSLLTGLRTAHEGIIRYDGENILNNTQSLQRNIAWVPQEYAFYPIMSVRENLQFFGKTLGLTGTALNTRIDEVIEITGLQNTDNKRCENFSGGMKRRLNVAIGLLGKPGYLFLDEPTVGIDPQSRHFILEAIKQISANGTTIIYSSHYMEEVQYLCNTIAIIDNGTVLTQGSLQELLDADRSTSEVNVDYYQLSCAAPSDIKLEKGFKLSNDRQRLYVHELNSDSLAKQMHTLAQAKVNINALHSAQNNLEQLFLQLTQRSLRD